MAIYQVGEKFRVAFGKDKHGWKIKRHMAVYECDCGTRFVMQCRSEKGTVSCGCFARETARELLTGNTHQRTHNAGGTGAYKSWLSMRGRCNDENNNEYHRYGGRGISVCEQWSSFEVFLKDMGPRPDGMSIDRVDPNGNYEPSNCKWSTPKEQSRNKRNNVVLTIDGESKTVVEWSEAENAASDKNIYNRIRLGWTHKEAVFGRR